MRTTATAQAIRWTGGRDESQYELRQARPVRPVAAPKVVPQADGELAELFLRAQVAWQRRQARRTWGR